ncbi:MULTISPECIES: hypothetical protein [Methylobacter]
MKEKVERSDSTGAHDGYSGEPGTYILKEGERVAVDPVTLEPRPTPKAEESAPAEAQFPASEPVVEKTKPAPEPAKKASPNVNKPE